MSRSLPDRPPHADAVAGRGTGPLGLMAVAAGLSVAGNYFAQPLLGVLRLEFGLSASAAGGLVTATQMGYALGLALLVPLGDRLPRRGLAASLLAATGVLLAAAGLAPNGTVLVVATALAAVASVGAQVLVPFAAGLVEPQRTGRAVAIVMSGVLFGGLAGRAVAGAVADLAGWRTVYGVTAVLLIVVAAVVVRRLPTSPPAEDAPAVRVLLSTVAVLLIEARALRRPVAIATTVMASYSAHLTALTLLLVGSPFSWTTTAIGAFGLLVAVGPLSMPFTGALVDRGHGRWLLVIGIGLVALAWIVMVPATGGATLAVAAGVVLLNLGQQAVLTVTQTTAYALRPDARNQVNAAFMTVFFAGGAAGSAGAALIWAVGGWTTVCLLAALLAAGAFALTSPVAGESQ